MSSCFPRAELPHSGTIAKQQQPTMIKPDIRSALPSRPPGAAFPFLADGQIVAPKIHDIASAIYGLPYSSPSFYHSLPAPGIDVAALYNSMNRSDLKDFPAAWRSAHPPFPPCDPAIASLFYGGGLSHFALTDGTRRKNATRETTSVLKEWLDQHKKNPYPTKAEKILLAVESKMSLTQVSTWFANARRRLKKENKMTWSPRNCGGEERDSGDDNVEQNFPISPRDQDDGINLAKSNPSPLELPEMRDSTRSATSDIAYQQQLQQQMIWRQLALLPPSLRTTEAIKHIQEQMQLRSRWAATVASEPQPRNAEHPRSFVSPPKLSPNFDSKLLQERRNSVGSPSTSSYDRSPSPFQRIPQSTWAKNSVVEQPKSFRKSSCNSDSQAEATTKLEEVYDATKPQRTKSSDDNVKTKLSIWSPANMLIEKESESKHQIANNTVRTSIASVASTTAISEHSPKPHLISTTTSANSFSENSMMVQDKSKLSLLDASNQSLQATLTQAYMREIQRHLTSQQTLQNQHCLPSVMLPMAIDKNQNVLRNHLLEQLQRNQNFQSKLLLSSNEVDNADRSATQSQTSEEDTANGDTPINLSKNVKLRESTSSHRSQRKGFEVKSESWLEGAVPVTPV